MASLFTFPTCVVALGVLLLAEPALAAKPPIRQRPAMQQAPALGKAAAAPRQTAPTTVLAVVTPPPAATFTAVAPAAPQVIKLRGVVRNPDGQPCAGASVYPSGAPRQLVITDAQGAFALPVPAGSAVTLRVEYFGLGSSRIEVPAPTADVLSITLGK